MARKLYNLDCNTLEDIYGVDGGFYGLMKKHTAEEALAKIEAYEKEKQIQVGDEIAVVGSAIKGYVIDKSKECEDCYVVLITNYKDFRTAIYNKTVIKKTGRHIDIQHLLEQIRGNE